MAGEKKANAAKVMPQNPGQKKGLEKCAKLTDATKKQACIAQQAQARKEFGKSKGKAKKDPRERPRRTNSDDARRRRRILSELLPIALLMPSVETLDIS